MKYIIGVDEVGLGPLAGPVTACAVMLPEGKTPNVEGVTDSKKLPQGRRKKLHKALTELPGLYYHVASRTAQDINERGISVCHRQVFEESIEKLLDLGLPVSRILIDGQRKPLWIQLPVTPEFIVKGDASEWSIGAASIIAKVERDNYMVEMDLQYPEYDWSRNKGYGTKVHQDAIRFGGLTPLHRKQYCRRFMPQPEAEEEIDVEALFGE